MFNLNKTRQNLNRCVNYQIFEVLEMKIGIPRALLYYNYFPLWKSFFNALDCEVVLSSPTNRKTLKEGINLTVDDACLPVKLYHGHVLDLIGKVDAIYVPRFVSIQKREYICPKFLGLPDMVRNSVPDLPLLIDTEINLYKQNLNLCEHFFKVGEILGKSRLEVLRAYGLARRNLNKYKKNIMEFQIMPNTILNAIEKREKYKRPDGDYKATVLLLGHSYNIYDRFISMDLIRKLLQNKIKIITSEMVSLNEIMEGAKKLSKDMFWTLGKNILGTAYYYLDNKDIDGIIHVASFGCGPDSLVGELLERRVVRDYSIPFLFLNLDEHSGEAGFNTRLEAFLDIVLEGGLKNESNLPTYG